MLLNGLLNPLSFSYMDLSFFARTITLGAVLALAGAGCGSSASPTGRIVPSGAGSLVAPETSSPLAMRALGACEHPFYPLRTGYEVSYRINNASAEGAARQQGYTQRVTEASGATARLVTRFQDLEGQPGTGFSADQTIQCGEGSLHATAYVDFSSRLLGGGAASQFRTETNRVTGELLPRDLHVGSEWDSSFDISMVPNNAGAENGPLGRGMSVTVRMHRKAVAEESVTVPAGTYRAMKIEATTDLGMGASGAAEPYLTTEWWVRGVGLVKSDFSSNGRMGEIVTEAERIVLP